jgi:phosphoenolpyruvate carboxykinase (ATP)
MPISYTREIIRAILEARLARIDTVTEKAFGLSIPVKCPGVPDRVLDPRQTWGDPEAYDVQARKLAAMFQDNFKAFADTVSEDIANAGPPVS